jgi:hypothetical protein
MCKDYKLVSCPYFGLHHKHCQWIFHLILLVHSILKTLCELLNLLSTEGE